jgi:hypothetical protein
VRYVNDAECYEEAVTTWRSYWKQRYRWAKGHMQVAFKHLGKFLRAEEFSFVEKLEMTMLLSLYFTPVLMLVGWILGILAYFFGMPVTVWQYMGALSIVTYSTTGNFAPFFEVGAAAYMDNRKELLWMLPALMVAYFVTVFICTKALIELLVNRNGNHVWVPTVHNGNNNHAPTNNNRNNGQRGDHTNQNGNGYGHLNGNGGNGHKWDHTNHNGNGYKYLNGNGKNGSTLSSGNGNNSNDNHKKDRRVW